MKSKIVKTETIQASEFSAKATVITLSSIPGIADQNRLFGMDESIILEF